MDVLPLGKYHLRMDRDSLQAFLLLLTCLKHAFDGKPLVLAEGRLTHSVEGFYFIYFLYFSFPLAGRRSYGMVP